MKQIRHDADVITIYEYEEAERLLHDLAERYEEDITIERRGQRKRKIAFYNYPCAFDIETTTVAPGQLDYDPGPDAAPVAFPYLFQWCIYGRVIMVRTMEQALDVFRWIAEAFGTDETTKLVIFDHNLGYEWAFFRDLWDVVPGECFALDEHHPVTVMLKSGLMIRDSYKMTNMSLQTLTKDWSPKWKKESELMDYYKLRTPYDELDEETLLYSALDVLSLSDAMRPFLRARGEEIWTRCPTSTSFIRQRLKQRVGIGEHHRSAEQKRYMRLIHGMEMDAERFTLLQELARGGNTHANRHYIGQEMDDLCHFDITSSYPAQMVCYDEYPLGEFIDLGYIEVDRLMEIAEDYCIMCRICLIDPALRRDIDVTVPYIATAICSCISGRAHYSDNGRYIDGAHQLVISVFGVELPIIIGQYDFSDIIILKAYAAPKGYLPDIIRTFILDLYKDKTELKGIEGMEVEYGLAKSYINGVYGMAYTNPIRTAYEFIDGDIVPAEPKDLEEELQRFQRSTSYFLPYAWGAMTACLGRVYLQKMIDCVGSSFVYADTDSVFAIDYEKSSAAIRALEKDLTERQRQCGLQIVYNDRKGRPQELGSISEEPRVEKFKTFGAKKYVTVEEGVLHCTIAGVPKKTGAKVIGTIDRFELGLNFTGTDTGKLTIWYNPDDGIVLHDSQGRPIRVRANAAMLPCNYLLGISEDFRSCLWYENVTSRWDYEILPE